MMRKAFALCLIHLLFTCPQCLDAQVDPDITARFKSARTVSLEIEESYRNAPDLELVGDYENAARPLFSYAGLRMVQFSEDSDHLLLSLKVEGTPLSSDYGSYTLFAGAILSGHLSLSMRGTDSYESDFRAVNKPPRAFYAPEDYVKQLQSEANAPYDVAIHMKGGFGPALSEALSRIFGADFIIKALQDDDEDIRHAAAINAAAASSGLMGPLSSLLKSDKSYVRQSAAEAMGYLHDPRVVEPLVFALNDDIEAVRGNALIALGRSREQGIYHILVDSLKNHSMDAIQALACFNDLRSVEVMLEFKTAHHPHDEYAVKINKAVDTLVARHSMEELISLYSHTSIRVQSHLMEPIVHRLSRGEQPPDVAPLIEGLASDNRNIKMYSNSCFSYIKDERAVKGLIINLNEGDQPIYNSAMRALIFQGNVAVEPLIVFMESEEASIWAKRRAVEILSEINDPRAIIPMVNVLKGKGKGDANPSLWREYRSFVKDELKKFNHESCVAPLIQSFSDNEYLNLDIAQYIRTIGDTAAPELLLALNDPDPIIAKEACMLLGHMDASEVFYPLIGMLYDERLGGAAIYALGTLQDIRSVEPLLELFRKNKKKMEFSINQALNRITRNNFYWGYKDWNKWWLENKSDYL